MRKLLVFVCIIACFFAQAAFAGGKSDKKSKPTTQSPQDLANNALSALDNALDQNNEVTLEDAYYLGRAVTANILATYKPYTQKPALTGYVNRICDTIAINSPQPEMFNGYHVIILDSPEFNAFASPGGHILLTKGLVEAAASEDMLAAVIAHEFAHIMLKHGVSMIADMRLTNDLTAVGDRASAIAARESPVAARAALFRGSVIKMVDTMLKSGYSQTQEFEADATAIKLLAAAGYNPGALTDMLKVLPKNPGGAKSGFSVTHPSPDARIANANAANGSYNVQDTTSFRVPRFKTMNN